MYKNYLHKNIEINVQKYWYKKNIFKTIENYNKKKYYVLCMIPYPSGNLHIGHVRNYTIGDIISRYNRMIGKNVMQPIGWDAFGLPAETTAIKKKILPSIWTYKNIKNMKKQLNLLGFSYDWDKEIITCKPNYYKWEQWFFIKLYKKKFIYKKKALINWCEHDKTVLANEQVINNNCWRCDNKIKKKKLLQWFLKTNLYSKQLLNDLKYLKHWPIKVKNMQKNWIGKNIKFKISFDILNNTKKIIIYINKIDFLLYTTYIIISIDNLISIKLSKKNDKINKFINKYKKKKKKNTKGINTNLFAIHPILNIKLPIWIVNFNLNNFYKSNIAIPKFNKDNLNFAIKYNIPIKFKISENIKKLNIKKQKKIILKKFIHLGLIKKKILYNLMDWNISRQRYWGNPIPIINIFNNILVPISQNKLPIILPENIYINNLIIPFKLNLNWSKMFIKNQYSKLEIDTLDTFIESSWYYIRYTCLKYNKNIIKLISANYWLPVDQYIGGIEHATMHLLYLRFFHKIFRDFGLINYNEPVKKLICQGMVLSHSFYYINKTKKKIWLNKKKINIILNKKKIKLKDKYNNDIKYNGMIKMSKSKNNGINLINIIKKYGSDTIRLFIIFAAPIKIELEWNEFKLIGIFKFLKRFWKIIFNHIKTKKKKKKIKILNNKQKKIIILLHKLINEVTYNIKYKQSFNIIISKIIKFINILNYFIVIKKIHNLILHECLLVLIRLLYPFIPHLCFKAWKILNEKNDIDYVSWPIFNKKLIIKKLKIIIQINSKFYTKINIKYNYNKEFIFNIIKKKKIFKKNINNILKIIYIEKKIFNVIFKK
ncbi:MAG: leucine--tRNA ligase [Enterobacteriaceae bacterium PC38]|nr:MAG: leucine--tRNA ligase [Enterobacteriaceae bacterium PC38]